MKRRKHSFKEKLQYRFDIAMSSGMKSMIKTLFVATLIIVIIFGLIISLASSLNPYKGIWISFMHVIDPGTLTADEDGFIYMLCMTLVTFFGIAVFSTLVGIINTGIQEKLELLKKGKSKILEEDHIVILGFDNEIYTILEELIEANKAKKEGIIVILDGIHSLEEMQEKVSRKIPETYNTKIIYRTGTIYDVSEISKCSIETCKSIIVNVESDALSIKCILAVATIINAMKEESRPHITAVINNKEYSDAAFCAAGKAEVKLLNFEDIIAKIIAQSSRYHGVSEFFEDLFGYEGSEVYIKPAPKEVDGVRMEDISLYYQNAICIGKEVSDQGEKQLRLYPLLDENQKLIKKGERLIFLAENENDILHRKNPMMVEGTQVKVPAEYTEKCRNILILRYSTKIESILLELRKINKDVKVTVAVKEEYIEEMLKVLERNDDMDIRCVCEDCLEPAGLKYLIEKTTPDSVIVLSNILDSFVEEDTGLCNKLAEKDDSEIIILLLQLRSLINKEQYNFSVTSEIQYSFNQKLVQDTGVNDFVVGSRITNRLLAQIAQEKDRYEIFEDLITAEGTDVLIRNVTDYLDVDTPYKLSEIKRIVALSGEQKEVFIGYMRGISSKYRHMDQNHLFSISRMNPQDMGQELYFDDKDALIVLGNGI